MQTSHPGTQYSVVGVCPAAHGAQSHGEIVGWGGGGGGGGGGVQWTANLNTAVADNCSCFP